MSFNLVSKIGLPLVAGFSIFSIPKALNENKRSRSFYENDQELDNSNVILEEPKEKAVRAAAAATTTTAHTETEVVSKLVDGYKINTSNFLETHLNSVRKSFIGQLNYVEAEYNNLKSAANNEYNNLASSITSLYDPVDQFLPSFIYALTTALSGSVLVNKKSLPIRFFTPLIFAIGGFRIFLPKTFDNTIEAIKTWESKEYPELLSFQKSIKQAGIDAEKTIIDLNESFNQSLIQTIHDIRVSLTK